MIESDLKENPDSKEKILGKYSVIKSDKHFNNEWQLYFKYQNLCNDTDFVIPIDGRDELISRHVLSIINS